MVRPVQLKEVWNLALVTVKIPYQSSDWRCQKWAPAVQPAHYKPRSDVRTGQTLVPVIRSNYRKRAQSLVPELDSRRMQVLDLCVAQGAFYSVLLLQFAWYRLKEYRLLYYKSLWERL
jgi:hypothetical protein